MKKLLADLLLIAGVIVASLAAAESRRVSRIAPLDADLSGEVLHASVSSDLELRAPDVHVYLDRTVEAGTPLTPELQAWMRALGLTEVSVLRQARDAEPLPTDGDRALGRVLSESILLSSESEEGRSGRIIDETFVERLRASELTTLEVERKLDGQAQWTGLTWNLRDPAANPSDVQLAGMRLAQNVTVPVRLKPGTYLDELTLERLRAAGLEEVSVRIPQTFEWRRWGQRWTFLVGVGLTLLGVLLKRSRVSLQEVEERAQEVEALGAELAQVEAAVAQVQVGLQHLDCEALHELLDPLLSGPVFRFAEGREAVRTAHGTRTYLAVMDAFARAERRLNRAWSAAVDGYPAEARESLQAALAPLREARQALPGAPAPPEAPSALPVEDGELVQPPDVPTDP